MSKALSLALVDEIYAALVRDAVAHKRDVNVHAIRLIEDHVLAADDLLDAQTEGDLRRSRKLIERVEKQALALVTAHGIRPSLTYDAIEAACAEPGWLDDYSAYVRDNPYRNGNPRKHAINQNLGYYVKKAVGARSIRKADGKPANVKVINSIIQSYTPLEA